MDSHLENFCSRAASILDIAEIARERYGIRAKIVEYKSYKEAQNAPWPFAVSGLLYDGKLVADHPIGGTRFQNIMEKEVGIMMISVRKSRRLGRQAKQ